MTNTGQDLPHPITNHLRHAADHIRLANHATRGDYREVTDLYDTFGALSALLKGLPQLVAHLHHILDRADASLYETDNGSPAAETLNTAELATDEAFSKITIASNAIDDAWSAIGRLRIHDPDATDPA
jgi:hypothetical protein